MKRNEFELSLAFRSYCINNNLCSSASINQYEKMTKIFSGGEEEKDCRIFDFLAAMLWICSKTEKTINQISSELSDLYLNNI